MAELSSPFSGLRLGGTGDSGAGRFGKKDGTDNSMSKQNK